MDGIGALSAGDRWFKEPPLEREKINKCQLEVSVHRYCFVFQIYVIPAITSRAIESEDYN